MGQPVKGESSPRVEVGKGIDLGRSDAGRVMAHALNQFRLALSEVRIVARRQDGVIVHERVVNRDAVKRAGRFHARARHAVTTVAAAEIEREVTVKAELALAQLERELHRLLLMD